MRIPPVLAAGLVLGAAIAGPIAGPAHAAATVDAAALLPKGFKVESVVRGDIDGDAKADYVVIGTDGRVPLPEEMLDSDGDGNRLLMLVSSTGKVYGTGKGAVICRRCGGAFWGVVTPMIDVSVAKGVVSVSQSAGANEVTDWTHRYRVEKGRVRLIGLDRTVNNRATGVVDVASTNLVTGLTVKSHSEQDVDGPTKRIQGKPRTVYLENVTVD